MSRARTEVAEQADKTPYRKLELGVWLDERFRAFSRPQPNAQTLWVYLLTGPRTTPLPGIVHAREAVMADDLGWDVKGFRDAFQEVIAEGLVDANWDAGVVVIRKALFDSAGRPRDTSKPSAPNVLAGWAKHFKYIPECSLKYEYLYRLEAMAIAMGKAWEDAFRKGFAEECRKASRIQRTENSEQREESCRAPAEPTPLLALTLEPSDPPKERKPKSTTLAVGDHRTITDAFVSRYEARYGSKPTWGAKQGAMVNGLLRSHSASEIVRRVGILFTSPPSWLEGPYDLGTLVRHFDILVQPAEPPKPTRPEPKIASIPIAPSSRRDA